MSPEWFGGSRWTIARRDLAALSREKTIVLALVIQLFIAAFSSFLVVGLTALYDPGSTGGQDITVAITGDAQDRLLATAQETDGVAVETYETDDAALAAFEEGSVDAVLSTTARATGSGSLLEINAIVPAEDLRTTVIVVSLREYLSDVETAERNQRVAFLDFQPLEVPDDGGASPYFGFTYTILLPLLLFLPPFISGSIAVDSITEEIERGTLELLRVAPVSLLEIVDGKAAGMIALAPLQAILWIALLRFNGISIANVPWLVLLVTAVAGLTVVVGLVLGLLTRRRQQAQLLYSMLVLLLFAVTVLLPEHPASTVAKLAVDSPSDVTVITVLGFAAIALVFYALTQRFVERIDPESL